MEQTSQKNSLYTYLLCFAIVVSTLNNFELTFISWVMVFLVSFSFKYSAQFLSLCLSAILILVIGIISSFFNSNPLYETIRDITYLSKPLIGLFLGYQIVKKKDFDVLKAFIYAGVVLAIIHFSKLFYGVLFLKIYNIHELRHIGGYFNDFEIYSLVLLIFYRKLHINFSQKNRLILLAVLATSSLLYFARINIIQFFILYVALAGYLKLTKKSLLVLTSISVVVLLSYSAIYISNPNRNSKGFEAFLYKIKIAPIEPFKTKINKEDWKDFNDNYRSFENILTVKQVTNDGFLTILFGKGCGSTIKLGRQVFTNDGEFISKVPILHNSYMTIFLKSGAFGVMLLIIFIVTLIKQKPKIRNQDITNIHYILVGTAFFLVLSNWVFMGIYFKVDNKSILIGALYAYRENLIKSYRLLIAKES